MVKIKRHPWRANPRPLPDGNHAVAAIGDVHGRADLLDALYDALAEEVARLKPAHTTCILIGDVIDRGPDSLDCLGLAADGLAARARGEVEDITLLGNHDVWMRRALDGSLTESDLNVWGLNGGTETWESFGLKSAISARDVCEGVQNALPDEIKSFVQAMPLCHRVGNLMFVHAGLDPRRPLDAQDPEAMIWIRSPFLDADDWPFEVLVVHGHTIDIPRHGEPEVFVHRIGIDTGAVHSGMLTAVLFAGDRMRFVQTARD